MKLTALHSAEYVDTPRGIFTAAGVWFHTREASLRRWAGDVLAREPLPALLAQAERWLRSPQTLALWVLPASLFVLMPLPAALAAFVVYVGWAVLGPAFVSRALGGLLRVLDLVLVQALYYVFMLSVLAAQERFAALAVGLAGFVLLRWGAVAWATRPLTAPLQRTLYRLPVPDRVLRALIVRAALAHRVTLPEFERIEKEILDNLPGRKR